MSSVDTQTSGSSANPLVVLPSGIGPDRGNGWVQRISLLLLAAYVVAAIVGPYLVNYDSVQVIAKDRLLAPGATRADGSLVLLGTDQLGRDVFGQVIEGARVSLLVGILVVLGSVIIGALIGLIAGYVGGIVDAILMRIVDVQLAFPTILLAIFVASIMGRSVVNVIITLIVTRWVVFARVTRGQVLSVKNREFVDATRTLGAGPLHIIRRCLIPACAGTVLIVATVELGLVILAEASLSFLNLGAPASTPSWGLTIAQGRDYIASGWWIAAFPGLALSGLVICVGIVGDGLRDRLDPKMKGL